MRRLPLQKGDILETFSSTKKLKNDFGYSPSVKIEDGIRKFVRWFKEYYKKWKPYQIFLKYLTIKKKVILSF